MSAEYVIPEPPKPRGAPAMFERVEVVHPFTEEKIAGKVVQFLSSQFVIELDDGRHRVIGVSEQWKRVS